MKLSDLFEGEISNSPLFRITSVQWINQVLKTKTIRLAIHTKTGHDRYEKTPEEQIHHYFLSTARSTMSEFITLRAENENGAVIVILNGSQLKANNKIKPHQDQGHGDDDEVWDELEDRVISSKPMIKIRGPLNNTIKEVRFLLIDNDFSNSMYESSKKEQTELKQLCATHNIPFKVFNSPSKFIRMK